LELEMLKAQASQTTTLSKKEDSKDQHYAATEVQMVFPPDPELDNQEVRVNRAALEAIVNEGMYYCEGLLSLRDSARRSGNRTLISVPRGSKEIKAQWLPITDESQKKRYLWREKKNADGTSQIWGLVALHISTKDLPYWFWADFGHIDCEIGKNACGGYVAASPAVDRTTRGPNGTAGPHGANGVRKETEKTVWANYILRGTQISFTKATGENTYLYNPVIEAGAPKSSCMSCHARASIGSSLCKDLLSGTLPTFGGDAGPPDPKPFGENGDINFLQTDFMWAPVVLAKHKK
jgi:hypothetical protein